MSKWCGTLNVSSLVILLPRRCIVHLHRTMVIAYWNALIADLGEQMLKQKQVGQSGSQIIDPDKVSSLKTTYFSNALQILICKINGLVDILVPVQ